MRSAPAVRLALLFAALLSSLTLVVWRQSEALEALRRLDVVKAERVVEEARRASLARRVDQLESRARVSEEARQRFGMRLPAGNEIVILPLRDLWQPLLASRAAGADRKGDEG